MNVFILEVGKHKAHFVCPSDRTTVRIKQIQVQVKKVAYIFIDFHDLSEVNQEVVAYNE